MSYTFNKRRLERIAVNRVKVEKRFVVNLLNASWDNNRPRLILANEISCLHKTIKGRMISTHSLTDTVPFTMKTDFESICS
jgi:3-dehydroquinate synthase class II